MQVELEPGKYVVAVSGGVDSMVLLHVLHQLPGVEIIVAHANHGMRDDSILDQNFVAEQAAKMELQYCDTNLELGPDASEATARQARYAFLELVKAQQGAAAIVTAHHQDDAIETAILNLARGTGRRGLTALGSTPALQRPLLNISKAELVAYARERQFEWCEDSSNINQRYLRNYIRHSVVPQMSQAQRQQLIAIIAKLRRLDQELDLSLGDALQLITEDNKIDRQALQQIPNKVAKELLTAWWRQHDFRTYETATVVRAFQAMKRGRNGSIVPLKKQAYLRVNRTYLALRNHER